MSFLLDVADPSIHFHARQSNTNTPSKGCSSLSKPTTSTVETSSSKPAFNNTTNSSPTVASPQASLAVPVPQSIFSAMSRMIRTASGSNIGSSSNGPSSSAQFSSSPPSLASSATSTASTTPIATPSEFLEKPRNQSSHSGFHSASTSPWLIPNVCDDEQMNKLVSFQL